MKSYLLDFLGGLVDVLLDVLHQAIELLVLPVLPQQLRQQLLLLLVQKRQVLYHRPLQLGNHLLLGLPLLQFAQQPLSLVYHEKLGQLPRVLHPFDPHVVLLQSPLQGFLLLVREEPHSVHLLVVHVDQTQLAHLLLRQLAQDHVVVDKLPMKLMVHL